MTRRVEITPRARVQLSDAATWWSQNRSNRQAAQWLEQIERAIAALAESCERFPLASEFREFERPLRQMNFGISGKPTHRVVFAIFDERVLIYAVRHLAQWTLTTGDLMSDDADKGSDG